MTSQKNNYLKGIDIIAGILLILGGLNWGMIGFFHIDVIGTIFGVGTAATRVAYALVGLSALYEAVLMKNIWRRWECRGFADQTEHHAAS